MKNLRIVTIGMFILAMLLSVNTSVYAQRGNGSGFGPGNHCMNIPDLTDDQQTKLEMMRTTQMKAMQDFRNQMGEKRARLQTLRTADKADMTAINKTIDEMSVIRTNMQKQREQHIQSVRNLLTEDQKVQFDSMKRGNGQGFGCGQRNGQGRGCGKGRGPNGRNFQ
ncbi:MAG: Spy/CpxP family protein refolding chaperone [Bacteroidetes bacterium]|jgi:Spy/CpxP family protein refolding chaperone|nr:Spy/CpxP family protein refolding chaperone [Bacteroidota bacterium]